MDKEQFYQMRLHRDTFESQKIERDTDFSFKVIDNNNPLHIRDNISDKELKDISDAAMQWYEENARLPNSANLALKIMENYK